MTKMMTTEVETFAVHAKTEMSVCGAASGTGQLHMCRGVRLCGVVSSHCAGE